VGEKRLVRIDEVGRTAAVATLVANGNGPTSDAPSTGTERDDAADGEDGVESPARRRGRRGGRRRSRAKADVTAGTTADDE
jgi:ribonuclease G